LAGKPGCPRNRTLRFILLEGLDSPRVRVSNVQIRTSRIHSCDPSLNNLKRVSFQFYFLGSEESPSEIWDFLVKHGSKLESLEGNTYLVQQPVLEVCPNLQTLTLKDYDVRLPLLQTITPIYSPMSIRKGSRQERDVFFATTEALEDRSPPVFHNRR
jgi:hypothetical protein